jgi:hypothetical protein
VGIKSSSDIFFIVSVAATFMAIVSWLMKPDTVWLAATQWLLIAITVGIWGVYLRLRDLHEGNGRNGKKK